MDGVHRERRRPSSCHCDFRSVTTSLSTSVTQQVLALRSRSSAATQSVTSSSRTTSSDTSCASVVQMVQVHKATPSDSVLDLSRKQPQPAGSRSTASNTDAQWDMYRRYSNDLKKLDELIRRRTYERNVLSWRRDQAKRSLERLLQPVKCTCNL